jgi:hypothetical protein
VVSDAPAWFDEEPDAVPRRRRRFVIVAAIAAASWIVLAVVLLRGSGGATTAADPSATPATSGSHGDAHEPDPEAADDVTSEGPEGDRGTGEATTDSRAGAPSGAEGTDGAEGADGAEGTDGTADGADATGVGREEAEALTIAVVRGWLSDGGPDLVVPGIEVDRRAYLEHVAVESIVVPSEGLAVARTLLVLLVRDGDHYTDAIVRRAAVPLTVTPTSVHPGGPPWWLPNTPDLTAVPPEATPAAADDAGEAVAAALEASGYHEVSVAAVTETRGGTLVADVTARTATGDHVDGPIWLHPTAQGLEVLGEVARPRPSADAPDATDPGG